MKLLGSMKVRQALRRDLQASEAADGLDAVKDAEILGGESSPPHSLTLSFAVQIESTPFTVTTERLLSANISKTWWM